MVLSRLRWVLPALFLPLLAVRAPSAPQQMPWRSPAMGDHGAVTAGHPLAAQAGLDVLKSGGNAVDAAITMAGVLSVVRPHMNGVGGDAFMLIYSARDGKIYGLNGSGRAGSRADADAMRRRGLTSMPVRGLESVTVPGAVDAWKTALARFGSRSLESALGPAVRLAVAGFPVSPKLHRDLIESEAVITASPGLSAIYRPGGRIPAIGDLLVERELGATLREIGASNGESLYRGGLADRLAVFFDSEGGLIRRSDLEAHHSEWVDPIATTYHGLQVYALPPNTQGIALLEMLNILGNYDLSGKGPDQADYLHILIEAKKLAFADRDAFVADPLTSDVPVDSLLSEGFALERAQHIDMEEAAHEVAPGQPRRLDDDTVVCTAADIHGNVVVLIESLFNAFGSGVLAGDTGIILQDRGALFSLEEGHPNELHAGQRPYHTLCPSMVLQDGKPVLGLATPGGDGQVQTLVQVLNGWHLFGMDIQQAIEAPRFRSYDGVSVRLEDGVGLEAVHGLEARGHELRLLPTGQYADFGGAQGIVILRRGNAPAVFMAGADPRREALALGW